MNVSTPTAHYFLLKYLDNLKISSKVQNLAEFYCYLALIDGQQYLKFCPSEIALASVILATFTFDASDFIINSHFTHIINLQSLALGVSVTEIKNRLNECMTLLLKSHSSSSSSAQVAIHNRYSSSKHLHVALEQPLTIVPHI